MCSLSSIFRPVPPEEELYDDVGVAIPESLPPAPSLPPPNKPPGEVSKLLSRGLLVCDNESNAAVFLSLQESRANGTDMM